MATSIKNVTVLGAGVLGAQIAFQSAYAGFNVVSYDINDDALKAAQDRFESIKKSYKTALPDEATDEKLSEASGRITQTADLEEAVKEADLVIEAVPEKIDLKKKVWTDVGKAAPEHTIFTSNTSTLLPSSFADASGAPERFLSFHFANRLWVQRLAEIMPTEKTDEKYVEELEAYANDMQMDPVVLNKEEPGYIINSLLVPFLEAGQSLWARGVADFKDIDRDWTIGMGVNNGPVQIMDVIGLRTVFAISEDKIEEAGAGWRKEFVKRLKEEYVDENKLGVETGEGFYKYDEDGNRVDD